MLTFLVQGIHFDDFVYHVDDMIKDNVGGRRPVFLLSSSETLLIECYDSEMGKRYEGAQALAMYIDVIRKQLSDG